MTLFTFRNPFVGAKLRVCQALILPIYQGQGWGKKMLLEVYKRTSDRVDTSEVTVEDPAPGFQFMRDAVDIEWALKHKDMIYNNNSIIEVADMASKLKITEIQAQFVVSAFQFHEIYPNSEIVSSDEEIESFESESATYRSFRLSVKRSLIKFNKDLKSLPKEEMQRELDNMYGLEKDRFIKVRKLIQKLNT